MSVVLDAELNPRIAIVSSCGSRSGLPVVGDYGYKKGGCTPAHFRFA